MVNSLTLKVSKKSIYFNKWIYINDLYENINKNDIITINFYSSIVKFNCSNLKNWVNLIKTLI